MANLRVYWVRRFKEGKRDIVGENGFGNVRYSTVIQTTLTPELLVTNQFLIDPTILLFYL